MLKIQTKYCDFTFLKKPDTKVASFDLQRALKWRIFSHTSSEESGKNNKKKIFPTGLEVHLEDMF